MASSSAWGLLDEKDENDLHKSRLLNVEVKPFVRITKHLMTLHSAATTKARQPLTPPPESNGSNGAEGASSTSTSDLPQLREDIKLDFAAFNSNIARLQFLLKANVQQRADYTTKRSRILDESQAVRDKTARLRLQLDEARATLEQRKKFDELADKITSNKQLRTRTEQTTNLKKLQEEIAELEDESAKYGVTWGERRDQFSKIMDESMRLRRLIRDEKEEVERREGMDEDGAGDAEVEVEGSQTPRPGLASGNATPRPESGVLPKSGLEVGESATTPRPVSVTEGQTPLREGSAPADSQLLNRLRPDAASGSRSGSQVPPSREPTPNRADDGASVIDYPGDDVEMGESKDDEAPEVDSPLTPVPADDNSQIVVAAEAGEEANEEKMDTT